MKRKMEGGHHQPKLITIRPKIQNMSSIDGYIVSSNPSLPTSLYTRHSDTKLTLILQASAMRAVSMGDGSFNNAMELIHKQNEDLSMRQQPIINGNHAGK